MNLHTLRSRLPALACALALTLSATAQVDRDQAAPVGYRNLQNATMADVQAWSAQGYRLSNFEIVQVEPLVLNCAMVRNTGVYAAGWLFYSDKTLTQLTNLCVLNQARIVDLERYEVNGEVRFAALLFVNTGAQQKTWGWYTFLSPGEVFSTVAGAGHRVIDLEPYLANGLRYYYAITIENSGDDFKEWWVYNGVTPQFLASTMAQLGARLYDFELETLQPLQCVAVMVRDDVPSKTLWNQSYAPGFDADVEHGGRVTSVSRSGLSTFQVTIVDNMNPFRSSGSGCAGTHGTMLHGGEGAAFTGASVTYRAENLRPWAPTAINFGIAPTSVDLAVLGAPGCLLLVDPLISLSTSAGPTGTATVPVPIPGDPSLAGLQLLTQMLALDPGANALGATTSNRLRTTLRSW